MRPQLLASLSGAQPAQPTGGGRCLHPQVGYSCVIFGWMTILAVQRPGRLAGGRAGPVQLPCLLH